MTVNHPHKKHRWFESTPAHSAMKYVTMDEEDEVLVLVKENKKLREEIKELKATCTKLSDQVDADRLKIDEMQQIIFSLRSTV